MMRRSIIACSVAALVFTLAAPALAVHVGGDMPPNSRFTWKRVVPFASSTSSPSKCPPTIDAADVLCDHIQLRFDSLDWNRYTGGVVISIKPASATNFDLFVFQSSRLVSASQAAGSSTETVRISKPSGTYEVRVVPVAVPTSLLGKVGATYRGKATFSVNAIPVQAPLPSTGPVGPSGTPSVEGPSSGSNFRPSTPRYKIPSSSSYYAGYPAYGGSYSPGGLYQGPSGGGTTQFGSDSGRLYYQSAYGGPVKEGVPQKVAESTRDVAVGSAVARAPKALWLLLPLALLLLGGVAYLVVEPEGRGDTAVTADSDSFEIPSRVALGGLFLKSVAGLGRGFRVAQRWVASLRNSSE